MINRRFHLNLRVTLFSLVCLVTFIQLGFWQLAREDEKREVLAASRAQESAPPLTARQLKDLSEPGYLPVRLSGRYLPEPVLLLDNVVLEGRVGFEVLHLFLDDSGQRFLVNRGFVAMGRTRDTRVEIPRLITSSTEILGKVYPGGGAPLDLESAGPVFETVPVIVQRIDIASLSAWIGEDIYPFVVRLDEGQQGALPRFWPRVVMPPEKHRGYAIQWFMMAMAVFAAWLFFSFPKAANERRHPNE